MGGVMWAAPCAGGFIKKDSVGLGRSRTRDLQNQSSRAGVRFGVSKSAHVLGVRAGGGRSRGHGGRTGVGRSVLRLSLAEPGSVCFSVGSVVMPGGSHPCFSYSSLRARRWFRLLLLWSQLFVLFLDDSASQSLVPQ
jgi:hypothetical protein